MPHFTLQISPQGALLDAVVGVSAPRHAALVAAGQVVPNAVPIRALVDTGSSITCIDPSVLQTLQLSPTGNTQITTPSTGSHPVNADLYDVGLLIPPGATNQAPLLVHTIAVICAELTSQGFHALIGRDVLAQCVFSYNGSFGWFTLAY